jgi:hypothetical protein
LRDRKIFSREVFVKIGSGAAGAVMNEKDS